MQHLKIALIALALIVCPACGSDSETDATSADTMTSTDTMTVDDALGTGDAEAQADDAEAADSEATEEVEACVPACDDKNCGPDGCGSSCGACQGTDQCTEGVCTPCVPACDGKACGDNGCGATCGDCGEGQVCEAGQCVEPPGAICLDMTPCLLAACAADSSESCAADNVASCGPADTQEQADATVALVQCMVDSGCALDGSGPAASCQRSNCLSETAACASQVNGDAQCHTAFACLGADDCPKDFATGEPTSACIASCVAAMSAEEAEDYWNLRLCVDAGCIGNEDYDDMALCFKDETEVKPTCSQLYSDCMASLNN